MMFAVAAKCDTISFSFQVDDEDIRHGKVVCPDENNQKMLLVYVNHRMIDSDKNQEYYSELTCRLLQEGISCCYYDNRKQSAKDSLSCSTLYDMAEDAVAVYHSLKQNAEFKKYKIGFYGTSEAGSSALIAASMVSSPAFLIQQSACVMPQIEKDLDNSRKGLSSAETTSSTSLRIRRYPLITMQVKGESERSRSK